MKNVKLYLGHAGYCLAKENHAIQGGRKEKIKFFALWGLIEHPKLGWILYDTGYNQRFFEVTKGFPNSIYAKATKVVIAPEEEVVNQLKSFGISATDIQHILITHFHADHVCALKDFPNATFYASRAALKQALKIPRAFAFSKGILKGLLPQDLEARTQIIEEKGKLVQDEIFGKKYDLFDDESLYLVPLPGHAAGQMGVQLETKNSAYFLIADACWLKRSYEAYVLPNSIVRLFFHSWKAFKNSLEKVHHFHQTYPDVKIVPTHCYETTSVLSPNKADLDVL